MIRNTLQKMAHAAQRMRAERGLFSHYRRDLFFWDRSIMLMGSDTDQYVWLVKECGTAILRIADGWRPIAIDYWIENTQNHQAFLVDVANEMVVPIDDETARKWARVTKPTARERRVYVPLPTNYWQHA